MSESPDEIVGGVDRGGRHGGPDSAFQSEASVIAAVSSLAKGGSRPALEGADFRPPYR